MTTLTIQIEDKDKDLFEKLAERLDVKIISVQQDKIPNKATRKAIDDARSGKITKIDNLDLFFKNL